MKIEFQSILIKQKELLNKIEKNHPLIHCLTNVITVNDVANVLTAIGASPIMAHHQQEVADITANAQALLLNLGATEYFSAMEIALQTAFSHKVPVILDPVGVGSSVFRRNQAKQWIEKYPVDCIRGNASEIKALAINKNTTKGVEASVSDDVDLNNIYDFADLIRAYAKESKALVMASGEVDIISDGDCVYRVSSGSVWMKKITGSGCMSGGIIAGFMAVEPSIKSLLCASAMIRAVAKSAEAVSKGSGSFKIHLIDAISLYLSKDDKEQINISKIG